MLLVSRIATGVGECSAPLLICISAHRTDKRLADVFAALIKSSGLGAKCFEQRADDRQVFCNKYRPHYADSSHSLRVIPKRSRRTDLSVMLRGRRVKVGKYRRVSRLDVSMFFLSLVDTQLIAVENTVARQRQWSSNISTALSYARTHQPDSVSTLEINIMHVCCASEVNSIFIRASRIRRSWHGWNLIPLIEQVLSFNRDLPKSQVDPPLVLDVPKRDPCSIRLRRSSSSLTGLGKILICMRET